MKFVHSSKHVMKRMRPCSVKYLRYLTQPCSVKYLHLMLSETKNMNYFILQEELINGDDVAKCPSCSLIIKVIYDLVSNECFSAYS